MTLDLEPIQLRASNDLTLSERWLWEDSNGFRIPGTDWGKELHQDLQMMWALSRDVPALLEEIRQLRSQLEAGR